MTDDDGRWCDKKYRRGANVTDGIDTTLSVISVGLAASGAGILSKIIAAHVAISIAKGWRDRVWAAGSRWKIYWPEASSES